MNRDTFSGKWKKIVREIKKQWSELTDEELERIGWQKDKLIGLLQEKYGWAKNQAEEEVNNFFEKNKETLEEIEGKASEMWRNFSGELSKRIQESPIKSLAVAVGVGIFLGCLFHK